MVNSETLAFGTVFPSCEELKVEQGQDTTLVSLFEEAVSEDAVTAVSCGYFVNDGLLMRKWTSPKMSCHDEWCSVFQVVVPKAYRWWDVDVGRMLMLLLIHTCLKVGC